MLLRRRFKQQFTLQDRLAAWSKAVRAQAADLAPGPERDALLKKARQAETGSHLNEWLRSPGLRPPQ
jgi:hypothetical protein